jgi:tetratricopeptide (TPR) repeat protein
LRSALHRQAAQALAGAGAPAERVAEQLLAAPDADDAWVVDWLAEAAAGLAYRAPQIAVQLLGRVHPVAPVGDRRRELLAVGLVTALFLLGRYEEVEQLAAPALASTRDPAVAGRLAWTLAYALRRMVRYEQALAVTGSALAGRALGEGWTARMRALQSVILLADGRYEQAEATARQAQAEGRQAGDRIAIAYALYVLGLLPERQLGDVGAVLDMIDRALAVLGHDPEATDLRLLLLGSRVTALRVFGRAAARSARRWRWPSGPPHPRGWPRLGCWLRTTIWTLGGGTRRWPRWRRPPTRCDPNRPTGCGCTGSVR